MRGWLKEKRVEHGYTMAQMAEKLDITESYYSMIEAGDRQKKMDMLLAGKLSGILDMTMQQISDFESQGDGGD